jgi:uncharacterized alkaline shock family protein YloU
MKKGLIRLFDAIVQSTFVVAGLWLVYANLFNKALVSGVYDAIGNMPLFGAAIGFFLILAVFLRLAGGGKHRDKERFINFESEDGSVGISTRAIKDFIERVGKEFAAVRHIDSKLVQDKNALDIAISVKVVSGNKIPELSQVLQQRVRQSVRESLGLDGIRNISIRVQEIVGEPAKHAEDVEPNP